MRVAGIGLEINTKIIQVKLQVSQISLSVVMHRGNRQVQDAAMLNRNWRWQILAKLTEGTASLHYATDERAMFHATVWFRDHHHLRPSDAPQRNRKEAEGGAHNPVRRDN